MLVSTEAEHLEKVLSGSKIAYSYFDAGDRLVFWNAAYVDLNYRIRSVIQGGAYFPDLLAELIVRDQIDIQDMRVSDWVEERLTARRLGSTAFRRLTDGRVFLVQERRDEVGGTLGFWLDVSDLFECGALPIPELKSRISHDCVQAEATQDLIRNQLQTVQGALELIRMSAEGGDVAILADDGLAAVERLTGVLDSARA